MKCVLGLATVMLTLRLAAGEVCVWEESFEGNSLNTAYWTPERDFVRNVDAAQLYTDRPENLAVRDGALRLTARHEYAENARWDPESPDWRRNRKSADYTSGSVNSRGKVEFRYGRVEIRARVEHGRGVWPALWLLGSSGGGWPKCGEIDILEYVSQDSDTVHCTLHYSRDGKYCNPTTQTRGVSMDGTWHVYGLEWTPERIVMTLDGKVVYRFETGWATSADGSNPYRDGTFFFILNQAVDGWSETPVAEDYPRTFSVDYVRLYQDPEIPGMLLRLAE